MKKGVILFMFLSLIYSVNGQELKHVCGVSAADQDLFEDRLLQNLATVEAGIADDRGGINYVPIHFHLVGAADGTGKAREYRVIEQLCALNSVFASVNIQFYLVPHPTHGLFDKSINSTTVYSNQDNTFLMQTRRHHNAINYYLVQTAVSGNNDPGQVLAYYTPSQDWIVSRIDKINGNLTNSTIPHETGHFFSLHHPFKGWESSSGFQPGYPGWPIAPVNAPDGGPTELQNGSNCTVAADKVCDTGPDYKFGTFVQSDCSPYNGGAKDPINVLVDPHENNIMGYFEACSSYVFSPLQTALILADLNSGSRNYLDNTYSPPVEAINTPTDLLVAPAHGSTVQYYNSVLLEWNAVPSATYYVIEVDIIPTFVTGSLQSFVTANNSLLVTSLSPNDTYYWRVKPFNPSDACALPKSRNFKTSSLSGTNEIDGLNDWNVSPNPVEGEAAHITMDANNSFVANINVLDAAGKVLRQVENFDFVAGATTVELPVQGLPNGFYFVSLDNGIGRDVRKFVVAK